MQGGYFLRDLREPSALKSISSLDPNLRTPGLEKLLFQYWLGARFINQHAQHRLKLHGRERFWEEDDGARLETLF